MWWKCDPCLITCWQALKSSIWSSSHKGWPPGPKFYKAYEWQILMYNKDLYHKANKVLLELRKPSKPTSHFWGIKIQQQKTINQTNPCVWCLKHHFWWWNTWKFTSPADKTKPTLPRRGRVFRGRALQPCASLSTTCPVDADMEWYEWIGFRQNMDLVWIYFGVQYRAVGGIHWSGITMGFKLP